MVPGTRVFHTAYGMGTVLNPNPHTHPFYIRVQFDEDGTIHRVRNDLLEPVAVAHNVSYDPRRLP